MIIVSQTQFHVKCEGGSSRFQLGEGPSRGLLRDYEPLDGLFSSSNIYLLSNTPGQESRLVDVLNDLCGVDADSKVRR